MQREVPELRIAEVDVTVTELMFGHDVLPCLMIEPIAQANAAKARGSVFKCPCSTKTVSVNAHLFTAPREDAAKLIAIGSSPISTRLQPGVRSQRGQSRFNGFDLATRKQRLKPLLLPAHRFTRLKPGANERLPASALAPRERR